MRVALLLFILLSTNTHAQFSEKKAHSTGIVTGFHSAGSGIEFFDDENGSKRHIRIFATEPYIGYFFNKNIGIGAIVKFTNIRTNVPNLKPDDLYEVGGFVRYYYPFKMTQSFLSRLLFLSEISLRGSNYSRYPKEFSSNSVSPEIPISYNRMNNLGYGMLSFSPIGLQVNIWKGLYVETSTEWIFYSKGYNFFTWKLGFEYQFSSKKRAH